MTISLTEKNKKIILIATQVINSSILFNNGLLQNIIFFYNLFEVMGYEPHFVFNDSPNPDTPLLKGYRYMLPEDIVKKPLPVYLYIEVGMSVEKSFSMFLREIGAKIVRLYLGHILNIDIETTTKTPQINFPHHSIGSLDQIWVSPHYAGHLEYACAMNRVGLSRGRIAPYIWMPTFLPKGNWISEMQRDFVIAEPNISFQKCALLPLVLIEIYAAAHPEWRGRVKIMNSERLRANNHFQIAILGKSPLKDRIDLLGRETVHELTANNPGGVFIGHHFNNEYNYMTLELTVAGWPVLHTSSIWKDFGYYWSHTHLDEAVALLHNIVNNHHKNIESYKKSGELLAWNYCIHNEVVQNRWKQLIEE